MAKPTKARGPHRTLISQSRRVLPSEKAAFHQVVGAGRSRVKRPFFGLTPADKAAIIDAVRAGVAKNLKG